MSWRVVAASAAGTSHAVTDTPCQDSCWAEVDERAPRAPILSMFVADGAGSAERGGEGAETAVAEASRFMEEKLSKPEFGLGDDFAVELISQVRDRLYRDAERAGMKARDFACTFIGLVSTDQGSVVMQVGDGAAVVDAGAGLELAIVPAMGEYANMTYFVTEEDALQKLVTRSYPGAVSRAALFSDGLQRLALNLATSLPHEPFFAPFFKVLGAQDAPERDALEQALLRFLRSDAVNERTDDDKTLALAVRPE